MAFLRKQPKEASQCKKDKFRKGFFYMQQYYVSTASLKEKSFKERLQVLLVEGRDHSLKKPEKLLRSSTAVRFVSKQNPGSTTQAFQVFSCLLCSSLCKPLNPDLTAPLGGQLRY